MRYLKPILVFFAVFFAAYLLGSFIAASFYIREWDTELRILVAGLGGVYSVLSAMACLHHYTKS